jgi:hypothetical protein
MSSELDNALNELEQWVYQDPHLLLEYILDEQGFYAFWQTIVAAVYEENPAYWLRLELAAHRLSQSDTFMVRERLVEQLLAKAEGVCSLTNEKVLLAKVRAFCLLLAPGSSKPQ